MRIRLQQINNTVGDISRNCARIEQALREAEQQEIDLLVLTEMVVSAYPPMDLLERPSFLERIYQANEHIITSTGDTAILFGTATPNRTNIGRPIYNSVILARGGKKIAEVHKTLLPTYDVFDESRYFEPNETFEPIPFMGSLLGITICEDIWYNENEIQYHTYDVEPVHELTDAGAELILNISASPFTKTKAENRERMLVHNAKSAGLPILYANQVGGNTEIVFDGDSMAIDADGSIISRAPLFEEGHLNLSFAHGKLSSEDDRIRSAMPKEERIFKAVVKGLSDYISKTGFSDKVIIGLSGGIDSALTAAVAVEALGPESVIGITMPSKFSSSGSVSDSEQLARNLGIEIHEIPIKQIYDTFLDTLEPLFKDAPFDVAEENIQARSRGVILMALSNKFGYMLVTTGNKSEMAVGYNTLYGDLAGGLAVISDIYKTEVFAICRWLNEAYYQEEVIPESIITKPPSAELRPDQQDSDSLPEYEVLDEILSLYIEEQKPRSEIVARGHDHEVVDRVIRMVDLSEYKRWQAPPGIKVTNKAFGFGRRLPIVQQWTGHEAQHPLQVEQTDE